MRETGGEGAPDFVLENGTKPQLDLDFIEVTVNAEYIAGWVRVSRKMLDDLTAFRSYLQMRLLEMYLLAEDQGVLYGNNTAPQLTGLMTNATASTSASVPWIERIIDDIAQLETSNYTADGVLLHPKDYYALAINKATGSGEYDLPGIVVIQNGQMYIAGVPAYKTNAIVQGTYLVGDFAAGAQLFVRENPRVEFFDQDRDNVITNKITVRIEGRVALAIYRVEAFIKGTFPPIVP
jgi:HK97 family phage major capsid protein